MKLIDAENQADVLTKYLLEIKETIIEVLNSRDNDYLFALMMQYFEGQPIDYDVNKVIKDLKDWTFNADINIGDGTVMNHNLIASENAINIVKEGIVRKDGKI